jgi:MYXO-CTERM domain-containing protein
LKRNPQAGVAGHVHSHQLSRRSLAINSRITCTVLATALALSSASSAAIVGVTGNTTWLGTPPPSCVPGALTGLNAYVWDEKTNVSLSIIANMTNNPGVSTAALAGPIAGNFDSHFLHFDALPGVMNATGTVTFSAPIVAVDFRALDLDATDSPAGALGTTYPTGNPLRGLSANTPSVFSINGNVLTFNLVSMIPANDLPQLRVFTNTVPAPGAAGLFGLAGALAWRRRRS